MPGTTPCGDSPATTASSGAPVRICSRAATGNDELIGGAGIDTLRGGAGDDTYTIDASDFVDEAPGAGFDTVVADFSATLGENLEALRLAGSEALDATGNARAEHSRGQRRGERALGPRGRRHAPRQRRQRHAHRRDRRRLSSPAVPATTTYVLSLGDGSDTIEDDAGVNVVRFGAGIGVSSLAADTYLGDDGATYLAVAYGDSGDALAIRDGLLGAVSEYRFADGSRARPPRPARHARAARDRRQRCARDDRGRECCRHDRWPRGRRRYLRRRRG